jgi:hypothetical protein
MVGMSSTKEAICVKRKYTNNAITVIEIKREMLIATTRCIPFLSKYILKGSNNTDSRMDKDKGITISLPICTSHPIMEMMIRLRLSLTRKGNFVCAVIVLRLKKMPPVKGGSLLCSIYYRVKII